MGKRGPTARNPKRVRLVVYSTDEINRRVERLADAYGMNKSATLAMLVAFGLNVFETSLRTSNQHLSGPEQAVADAMIPAIVGDLAAIHGE